MYKRKRIIAGLMLPLFILTGCNYDPDAREAAKQRYKQDVGEYLEKKYPEERFEYEVSVGSFSYMGNYSCRSEVTSLDTGVSFTCGDSMDNYGAAYYSNELYEDLLKYCIELSEGYSSFTVTDLWYPDGIVCYMGLNDNLFLQTREERLQTLLNPEGTSFYVNVVLKLNTSNEAKLEKELQSYIDEFPHKHYVNLCDKIGKTRYEAIMYTSAYGGDSDPIADWIRDERLY